MRERTLSKYIYYNCKDIVCQDCDGNVITGAKLDSEAYSHNEVVIVRFRNGFLDGDVFNDDGSLRMTLPAIEGRNHQEYWRKNKLHRDGGMPAVISGDPAQVEYWINGVKQNLSEQNCNGEFETVAASNQESNVSINSVNSENY